MTDEQMKYPIGGFSPTSFYTNEDIERLIQTVKTLPAKMRQAIIILTEKQLDTRYRTDGWSLRQLVHHVADSHMNGLTRFKLALTENNPTVKAFEEADWALLADYSMPVESSLQILEGIHLHLAALLESFTDAHWKRTFVDPKYGKTINLVNALALYAWHSNHHLAHITETVKKFS